MYYCKSVFLEIRSTRQFCFNYYFVLTNIQSYSDAHLFSSFCNIYETEHNLYMDLRCDLKLFWDRWFSLITPFKKLLVDVYHVLRY